MSASRQIVINWRWTFHWFHNLSAKGESTAERAFLLWEPNKFLLRASFDAECGFASPASALLTRPFVSSTFWRTAAALQRINIVFFPPSHIRFALSRTSSRTFCAPGWKTVHWCTRNIGKDDVEPQTSDFLELWRQRSVEIGRDDFSLERGCLLTRIYFRGFIFGIQNKRNDRIKSRRFIR